MRSWTRVTRRLLTPDALASSGVLTALCLEAAHARRADVAARHATGLESHLGVAADPADAERRAAWSPTALVSCL